MKKTILLLICLFVLSCIINCQKKDDKSSKTTEKEKEKTKEHVSLNKKHVKLFEIIQKSTGFKFKVGDCRPTTQKVKIDKFASTKTDALPRLVDLRKDLSPVENQGEIGSCTANALAGAIELLANRQLNGKGGDVSRLYLYYNTREIMGCINQDSGAVLAEVVKAASVKGLASENNWDYVVPKWKEKPVKTAYDEGKEIVVKKAKAVPVSLEAMKRCLAEGYPIFFGVPIWQSFMTAPKGKIPMPNTKEEKSLGGHAMLAVGYSEKDKVFLVRNSWGPEWGDKGYCYIPFDYMANPEFGEDYWMVSEVSNIDKLKANPNRIDKPVDILPGADSFFEGREAEFEEASNKWDDYSVEEDDEEVYDLNNVIDLDDDEDDDGIPDDQDEDDDNDGTPDSEDKYDDIYKVDENNDDKDNDGVVDELDEDDDNDGQPDNKE